jgi:hypothetical protein
VAGWVCGNGYQIVGIGGRQLYAHRVAFALYHGRWPSAVDHVNGDPLDNRIENLREADGTQNNANAGVPVTNTSGFKGVIWAIGSGGDKWCARIQFKSKTVYLGRFDNMPGAALAYDRSAALLFGPFARLNFGPEENAGRRILSDRAISKLIIAKLKAWAREDYLAAIRSDEAA